MNRRTTITIALLASALYACGDGQNDARLLGELASDRVEVSSESSEPLIEMAVTEGQAVAAGQLLFRHDPARAEARLKEADAALAQARARLDELVRGPRAEQIAAARATVAGATRDLEFRKQEHERARRLYDRNLGSEELLDRTQTALDASEANLDVVEAQLEEKLSGTTIEELTQAEQAVKQAEARRDNAAIDVERQTVTAPVQGIVDSRLFELGERPSTGMPVVVILPGEQPHARVYVPADLRVMVAPGDNARVYVDGLDDALDGRVRWIASEAAFTPYYALTERDRGRLSYVAKIDILEQRQRLPDGLPAQVELPGVTSANER